MGTITDFDKISIIDLIIEHYPELKKDRTNLIKLVLQQVTRPNKLILEKITHDDKTYYKYNDGILIDENLNTTVVVVDNKVIIVRTGDRYNEHMKILEEIQNKIYN